MNELITALLSADAFRHPVKSVTLVETHISWVLLTGEFAYKIKKAVNFGFLNFSTLALRHKYCCAELELNRCLAAKLYLDVVKITGTIQNPVVEGEGEAIEYAVKMREFPQSQQFDHLLATAQLTSAHIEKLAMLVANFHLHAAKSVAEKFGTPESIQQPVNENFRQIFARLEDNQYRVQLQNLHSWSDEVFNQLKPDIVQRKKGGFVRACHGDMHTRNMALFDREVIIFDCIEFNDSLRWIDVISEVAFVVMDFLYRKRQDFALNFLNKYLEITGDYAGVTLLNYYIVYRAMVRAKVALLQAQQVPQPDSLLKDFADYIALAQTLMQPKPSKLIITYGLSGSGKSTYTQYLLALLPAIRVRSDVERKRLGGLSSLASSHSQVDAGIYTPDMTADTYSRLAQLAKDLLRARWNVIVDATFSKQSQRTEFFELAQQLGVTLTILNFKAPVESLRHRIQMRSEAGKDASEANLAVLENQLKCFEPLSAEELGHTIEIDTDSNESIEISCNNILERLRN